MAARADMVEGACERVTQPGTPSTIGCADGSPPRSGEDLHAAWLPLLRELGDLKRIRSAGQAGSIAERLFRRGWAALARGDDAGETMRRVTGAALAAARLGDLDRATLAALGLDDAEAAVVLERAFDEVALLLDPALGTALRGALTAGAPAPGAVPAFVERLADQPRAGVTCPGRPRLLLQPFESHAEHCLLVAVYGAILAPAYRADPVAVFVAGMAHHLHNAAMPDAGFTGEVLLGDLLGRVIEVARDQALAELPPAVAAPVREALAPIGADETAAARAFHAADVIDRVLEIEQHGRAAGATMAVVLEDYELVHAGPVKSFHDRVLGDVGLL